MSWLHRSGHARVFQWSKANPLSRAQTVTKLKQRDLKWRWDSPRAHGHTYPVRNLKVPFAYQSSISKMANLILPICGRRGSWRCRRYLYNLQAPKGGAPPVKHHHGLLPHKQKGRRLLHAAIPSTRLRLQLWVGIRGGWYLYCSLTFTLICWEIDKEAISCYLRACRLQSASCFLLFQLQIQLAKEVN